MTLHEAIVKVLMLHQRSMSTREIADELNNNKWYQKKDKSLITPFQIHGRTKESGNYSHLFNRDGSIVSLKNLHKVNDVAQIDINNLKDDVPKIKAVQPINKKKSIKSKFNYILIAFLIIGTLIIIFDSINRSVNDNRKKEMKIINDSLKKINNKSLIVNKDSTLKKPHGGSKYVIGNPITGYDNSQSTSKIKTKKTEIPDRKIKVSADKYSDGNLSYTIGVYDINGENCKWINGNLNIRVYDNNGRLIKNHNERINDHNSEFCQQTEAYLNIFVGTKIIEAAYLDAYYYAENGKTYTEFNIYLDRLLN